MEQNNYNLGTRPDEAEVYSIGVAYIVIPVDVDRAKFIAECYRTATVSIYSEHNGYNNRVPIDRYSLSFIEFPQKPEEYGSAVSFKVDPIHKRPVIDGIYFKSDELSDLKENQFKFKRTLNGNVVELVGSPDGKYLGINVSSTSTGGEVFINVQSGDESGKININVDGECNITALTNTTLKQYGKLSLVTIDREDENTSTIEEHTPTSKRIVTEDLNYTVKKFNINDGKENIVLGKKLKSLLDDFIQEVGSSQVTTALGVMPLMNAAQILQYKARTSEILSEVGFIDK